MQSQMQSHADVARKSAAQLCVCIYKSRKSRHHDAQDDAPGPYPPCRDILRAALLSICFRSHRNLMPRTRMVLKRPAADAILAPDENPVSEQGAAVAVAAVGAVVADAHVANISSSSSEVSDDAALSPAEANADEFSDDGCSTGADADASSSRLQRAATDPRTISVVTEPLKRDHRLLLLMLLLMLLLLLLRCGR